ncbi:MAG TPA: glycosyltransferase family 4 protein, partial [Candidatus Limnocylindria bacterium]|nr:glycosyltransferase family 4 protein [Candidatus Limnocylindria bacterium]
MRVIHVAPTAFGAAGLYGGGERYPMELARALAKHVRCELVTFGPQRGEQRDDGFRTRVVRPLGYIGGHPARPIAPSLPAALRGADVVHAHQARSPASIVAALAARMRGVPTAVTDHGLQGSEWGGLVRRVFDRYLLV